MAWCNNNPWRWFAWTIKKTIGFIEIFESTPSQLQIADSFKYLHENAIILFGETRHRSSRTSLPFSNDRAFFACSMQRMIHNDFEGFPHIIPRNATI